MPDGDWRLSAERLEAGAELAGIGAERVLRADRMARAAASGQLRDSNGIPIATLSSDSEDGYTICVVHGMHCLRVGADGKQSLSGICEWCWKENHSPEAIARRSRDPRALAQAKEEEEALRSKLEREASARLQASLETADSEADGRAVDEGHGPVGRGARGAGEVHVLEHDDDLHRAPVPEVRGPSSLPVPDDCFEVWLRNAGIEDDVRG